MPKDKKEKDTKKDTTPKVMKGGGMAGTGSGPQKAEAGKNLAEGFEGK